MLCVVQNVPLWKGVIHPFWQTGTEQPWQKEPSKARLQICFVLPESTVLMANDNLHVFILCAIASPYIG